jgi:O-antigen/teichoic acid export membrane protein
VSSPVHESLEGDRRPGDGDPPKTSAGNDGCTPIAFNRGLELLLYSVAPIATLGTAPILAHGLGPAGRGQYGVATAVATLAITLGSWGQAEIFLSRSRSGTDHYRMHSRISWAGGLAAGVLCVFVMLALGLPLSTALVTAVWIPVLTQVGLWRSASIARNRLKPPALDSAFGPLLRVSAFAALAVLALLTVDSALFAYQAALAIGSLLTVGLASWRSGVRMQRRAIGALPLLLSGTGIIAFNVLHAVTLRADLIVLQLVAPPTEVGLYAAPASLTTAAMALSIAYRPRVQAAAFSAAPLRGILSNCLQVFALAAIGTAALWLATPLIVPILFGSSFQDAEPIMRILVFAIVPLLMVDLVFAALIVLGRQRDLLVVAAGSAALNVAALCVLCPVWGAYGAALATVLSYGLATVLGFMVLTHATRPLEQSDTAGQAIAAHRGYARKGDRRGQGRHRAVRRRWP